MLRKARPVRRRGKEDAGSLEERIVALATSGKLANAGRNAIRTQRRKGLAVTFQRGDQVIKQFPDGREEVLATVRRADYTVPEGVEIIGGK